MGSLRDTQRSLGDSDPAQRLILAEIEEKCAICANTSVAEKGKRSIVGLRDADFHLPLPSRLSCFLLHDQLVGEHKVTRFVKQNPD